MCERCKPKNITLMLMVESHNGQMSVPMRVMSDMKDAQLDASGFLLNGLQCSLDLTNARFVLSFLDAAMNTVKEAMAESDVDPIAIIKELRAGLQTLTPEEIERILMVRRAGKKVLQ